MSPIKAHLLKINQNKRIRIAYHSLWHIDINIFTQQGKG